MSLEALLVALAAGRDSWKLACRAAATANVTLSGEQTVDSVALVEGERALLTAQTAAGMNGPWTVKLGAWTRPADFDESSKVVFGSRWVVTSGTAYGGTNWELTSPVSGTPALNVTALTITQEPSDLFTAALAAVYTYAPTLASIKAATATFIRGVTTGGVYITPGADGAATLLAGRNADATTAKPLAIDLGTTPVLGDVSKYFTLRSGAVDFIALRRWRSDLGGGISGYETQISALGTDNPGAVSDYLTMVFNRINFQPADILECNAGTNFYTGHGTNFTWYWRNGGPTGYTIDVQLRHAGITTFKARAGVTGVEWGYLAADADGVGGYVNVRGQQGAAGFVGGGCEIGGGNGGAGAVAGATGVNLGTPVANVTSKFYLRREDGTRILEMHQGGADQIHISGGPAGAETQLIQIRGTYINIEAMASGGHVSLVPNGPLYFSHVTGGFIYEREGSTLVRTTQLNPAGVTYSDIIAGVTSFEMRKAGSSRLAFDSTSVTVSADVTYRKNAAGTEFDRARCTTATISTATTTIVESVDMASVGNGTYDVEMWAGLYNTTDGEGAGYYRRSVLRKSAAGSVLIGATDAGGSTDKEEAGQVGNDATITKSAGHVIQFNVVTDSTNEHKWDVQTRIRRRAA